MAENDIYLTYSTVKCDKTVERNKRKKKKREKMVLLYKKIRNAMQATRYRNAICKSKRWFAVSTKAFCTYSTFH